MGLLDSRSRYNDLLLTLGKQALNALFPNDFEYYFLALELVDSKDNTIDYLAFPVLPDSFSEADQEITSITKTAGGIVTVTSPTFIPKEISIKGTFGKKFKFLIGSGDVSTGVGFSSSTLSGVFTKEDSGPGSKFITKPFNVAVKTGYGVTKILQAILDKSTGIDKYNLPYTLYLYNPMLGNDYIVEPRTKRFTQESKQNNAWWNYEISLTAVGRIGKSPKEKKQSMIRNFSFDLINKEVNKLRSSIKVEVL